MLGYRTWLHHPASGIVIPSHACGSVYVSLPLVLQSLHLMHAAVYMSSFLGTATPHARGSVYILLALVLQFLMHAVVYTLSVHTPISMGLVHVPVAVITKTVLGQGVACASSVALNAQQQPIPLAWLSTTQAQRRRLNSGRAS